ncbi:alpha/beta hydrolase fold domain-containing protein [Enterococcus xiangfangensis]|uniref:alpha/beta hydrolase fold domain-containing protein n=1 Tax=Enterococcus xiangfangensis TaxID=1296537 RepID=UPI003D1653C5|nr:alpha/beta hydrolase [Enterococcus asini]
MSIQLNMILLATRLLNVKKVFTLSGDSLKKEAAKRQTKIAVPKNTQFTGFKKTSIEVEGTTNYLFSKGSKKILIYLAGGGFILPISGLHWDYLDMLTKEMETDLLVLNYPLTPKSNVDDVMRYIDLAISSHLNTYETITLMGDSAGGNISLGYSQSVYNKEKKVKNIIALSPFVDFSLENEEITVVAKRDTIVSPIALKDVGEWYKGTHLITDPIVSPINGDYKDLNVLMISGTRDITNPDTKLLAEKNPSINYIQVENMPHIFMLYMIPESEKANQLIIDTINADW